MATSLVQLENVSRGYPAAAGMKLAVRELSLVIEEGDFIVLSGPSGSGKTTALNLICGIDEPTGGTVKLCGEDLSRMRDARRTAFRAANLGIIFQDFQLIPVLNAVENVMLPLLLTGAGRKAARMRAEECLRSVGLSSHAAKRPKQLSGGEQQRVAIARALANRPLLVLADEPTANLDSENAVAIIEMMRRLNLDEGVTFLFSTHDIRLIDSARRHLILTDGVLLESGT